MNTRSQCPATTRHEMGSRPGRRARTRPSWPRRVRAAAVITVMATTALLAAACGNSGSPQGGGSSARQQALAVARCMRSHGIPDFPNPSSNGTFANLSRLRETGSQFDTASHVCRQLPGAREVVYQQVLTYVRCMRSHGIPDLPDPSSNGDINMNRVKESGSQLDSAQNACSHLMPPRSGGSVPDAAQQQQLLSQAVRYSACMRSHGVPDFPDPAGPIGKNVLRPTGIDTTSPQYQTASSACHSLMPGLPAKGGGS